MEYPMFDKIIQHLERKKAKPTYSTDKKPIKVKYEIIDRLNTNGYIHLSADYNYYNINIFYCPEKQNPYHVYIETQCTFAWRQELGTKFWKDDWYQQEDVIEYIRYKLRDNKG